MTRKNGKRQANQTSRGSNCGKTGQVSTIYILVITRTLTSAATTRQQQTTAKFLSAKIYGMLIMIKS